MLENDWRLAERGHALSKRIARDTATSGLTWRDADGHATRDAVELDSEDEAVGGGPATAGALEGIASQLSFSELSQDA